MSFNAPFQQNMNFLNSGGGGMGFSAPQNDRANWGGGNSGFDFSQFPQFGQGYGSALNGGTNGYFGQGFGNSNFGQGFGNENFGQGFGNSGGNYRQGYGGGMSGGNDGQGFGNENFWQSFGNTNGLPGLNQPPPGQSVAEMVQQNNANFSQFTNPQQNIASPNGPAQNNPILYDAGSWGQPPNQQDNAAPNIGGGRSDSFRQNLSRNIGQGQGGPPQNNALLSQLGFEVQHNALAQQNNAAPTANQGYVNQFMTQKNTAPNIGRQSYRQALRGTRNEVGA